MIKRERIDPLALISKIADQEKELLGTSFIAPYVGGGKVRLSLNGIICEMHARDCPEGWAILEVVGAGKARFVQRAPLLMIRNYLRLFASVRLVLVGRFSDSNQWWAVSAANDGHKIQMNGPVPVHLIDAASAFDTVYCRFDGASFWYEAQDRRRDPAVARYLRKSLAEDLNPELLHSKGIVPQERLAYKMCWLEKHKDDKDKVLDDKTRISNALEHAGAQLESFWHLGGGATSVRFWLDGRTHNVQIRSSDLTVVSAGICLSGRDRDFDLSSLVDVFREAEHYD